MAWYRAGTVTVANGSSTVTGAGTDFVANAQIGHAFLGPDGKVYEIAQVEAAGQIVLSAPYLGGSGGGQGYAIMPTSSFARDLALGAAQLLNTFANVRDTVGQGLFPDGTQAAPGIRFGGDQDTGMRRTGSNAAALVAGGVDRIVFGGGPTLAMGGLCIGSGVAGGSVPPGTFSYEHPYTRHYIGDGTGYAFVFSKRAGGETRDLMSITDTGSITCRANTRHIFGTDVPQGQGLLNVEAGTGMICAVFAAVSAYAPNGANAALYLGRDSATGRSLNATGTVNASGADYAEYMVKAAGCGTIAKGDVCGVDRDGHLTKTWADAISFVIKSTDPGLVLGDTWGQSVGPRPEGAGDEPTAPIAPPAEPASDDEAAVEAWRAIVVAYPVQLAAYQSAHAAWTDAKAAYDVALPEWEAGLEAERQKVDRIAFSGQVPVNVTGDFAVGDYLIAAANGAGIKAVAVQADTITFDQYRRRLGKVWAVRDDRAWVDVQHG